MTTHAIAMSFNDNEHENAELIGLAAYSVTEDGMRDPFFEVTIKPNVDFDIAGSPSSHHGVTKDEIEEFGVSPSKALELFNEFLREGDELVFSSEAAYRAFNIQFSKNDVTAPDVINGFIREIHYIKSMADQRFPDAVNRVGILCYRYGVHTNSIENILYNKMKQDYEWSARGTLLAAIYMGLLFTKMFGQGKAANEDVRELTNAISVYEEASRFLRENPDAVIEEALGTKIQLLAKKIAARRKQGYELVGAPFVASQSPVKIAQLLVAGSAIRDSGMAMENKVNDSYPYIHSRIPREWMI